ncbi:hypothetical protein [Alteripontixanthobacter muriae]|uniref:hypothetical protein n=1 Tax=Alteripontixanthobacter muriae TaxID=2705546 RepID=UPI001576C3BE|nr:hypothetical protein [Alteripontixanthobacter muriae]
MLAITSANATALQKRKTGKRCMPSALQQIFFANLSLVEADAGRGDRIADELDSGFFKSSFDALEGAAAIGGDALNRFKALDGCPTYICHGS